MRSLSTKKKLLNEKIVESYFQEDESAEFPPNLLNKKAVQFLTSSIDTEEDEDGFEMANDFFDVPDDLLNITAQAAERGTNNFKYL